MDSWANLSSEVAQIQKQVPSVLEDFAKDEMTKDLEPLNTQLIQISGQWWLVIYAKAKPS